MEVRELRDAYFDNLKFLLVTLVVIGHLGLGPILARSVSFNAAYIFIYTFHMPLFVFITGYFSKNYQKETYWPKVLSHLIVPYIIFQVLYTVYDHFIYDRPDFSLTLFTPFYALWFLVSLATWRLMLPYVVKIKYSLVLAFVVSLLVGYVEDIGNYLSLGRTLVFFPFFLLGYFTRRKHLDFLSKKIVKLFAAVIIILAVILIYYYGQGIDRVFLLGNLPYSKTGTSLIDRITLFIATIVLSLSVMAIVPRRKVPIISNMGTRTMYPYLFHAFLVFHLYSIGFYHNISTPVQKALWIMFCVVFTMFLASKHFKMLTKWLVEPNLKWIFK